MKLSRWMMAFGLLFICFSFGMATEYHGNRETKVLHAPGCRYYDCRNCTRVFYSIEEAARWGYRPCKICLDDGDARAERLLNRLDNSHSYSTGEDDGSERRYKTLKTLFIIVIIAFAGVLYYTRDSWKGD